MKTLDQEITAIREKAEKEVALVHQREKLREATSHLTYRGEPLEFTIPAGWMHTCYADAHIKVDVPDLPSAIELAEVLNPVALSLVKDGCVSFCPDDDPYAEKRRDHATLVCPYIYKLDGISREEKSLRFFIDLEGFGRVEVRAFVGSDPDTQRHYHVEKDDRGRVIRKTTRVSDDSGFFGRHIKWWSTPDVMNPFTLYSP